MADHMKFLYAILLFTITESVFSLPMAAPSSDTSGPHFTSIQGPRVVTAGVRTDFTCSADCTPECTYTWRVSGQQVEGKAVTLTLDGHRDSVELECTALNPTSRDSQSARNTVKINNPVMVVPTTSSNPFEGDAFSLACKGSGPGITTLWLKDNELFPTDSRMRFTDNNGTLVFSSLLPSDAGFYTCVVANSTIKVASRGYLLSFRTITVTIEGPDTVVAGVEHNFTCVPNCSLECSISWRFKQFPQGSFKASGTLVRWTPARPGLVQDFTCVAENKLAQRTAQYTKRVLVSGPPPTIPPSPPPKPSASVMERPSFILLTLVCLQLLFALSA
ncbi:hypothetical protein ACEWY4_019740 [Coilia grayii]|uniref:Ig-like domain-containing protein n=1 Tax=Coilia grayii TaxID=363190 RepID=A0ABD1JAT6_9TELE